MTVTTGYGSPRRDSSFATLGDLDGRVAWSLEIRSLRGEPIESVVPWKGDLVVTSSSHLAVIATPHRGFRIPDCPGILRWTRDKEPGTPVAVYQDALYFIGRDMRLRGLDERERDVREPPTWIPGLASGRSQLSTLVPHEDGAFAVVQHLGALHDDPPLVRALCAGSGSPSPLLSRWGIERPGLLGPPPLVLTEPGMLYAVTVPGHDVVRVGLERGDPSPPFRPLDRLVEWSAGGNGVVFAVGEVNGVATAVAFRHVGAEIWRWCDVGVVSSWSASPPAVSGPYVYVFGAGEVVALYGGTPEWWRTLSGEGQVRGAAAADRRVVAVRGSVASVMSASGQLTHEIEVGGDVVAGPVFGVDGLVYMATARALVGVC